jgi:hypothetical protein
MAVNAKVGVPGVPKELGNQRPHAKAQRRKEEMMENGPVELLARLIRPWDSCHFRFIASLREDFDCLIPWAHPDVDGPRDSRKLCNLPKYLP